MGADETFGRDTDDRDVIVALIMDGVAPDPFTGIPREEALSILRWMMLIRLFEEKCAELYMQEKIRGFLHLYVGEEAIAAGCGMEVPVVMLRPGELRSVHDQAMRLPSPFGAMTSASKRSTFTQLRIQSYTNKALS